MIGLGTPKTPQVSLPPQLWQVNMGANDRVHLGASYEELVAARGSRLEAELAPSSIAERYERCQRYLDRLAGLMAQAAPDVVVVFGDEDRELWVDQSLPPFSIYSGEAITFQPLSTWQGAERTRAAMWAWYGDREEHYPVAANMATHLIQELTKREFDVAWCDGQAPGTHFNSSFAFVRRRIMRDLTIPMVPVTLNASFGVNPPSLKRCYALGRAIRDIVAEWDSTSRVAIVAAGGLSHIVIDEDFDREALRAIGAGDLDALAALPTDRLTADEVTSGSGEVRCWVAAGGALEALEMELIAYEPCYRSPAGTGCGLAFAHWFSRGE